MEKEAKVQYDFLLDSGDLQMFFPTMSGEWKKDKERFIKQYKINKEQIDKFDVRN